MGALRPEKNLELLLRGFALANIANARLALIGDGPCRSGLQRLAAELGIGGRVIFAGRADQPALSLPALDVFAMSSSTEQMSNAMLEAMATGLPVVTTNVGDSRELLGKEGGVVTPAGDLGGYASGLRAMAGWPHCGGRPERRIADARSRSIRTSGWCALTRRCTAKRLEHAEERNRVQSMIQIAAIVGARPNFMKIAPILAEARRRRFESG